MRWREKSARTLLCSWNSASLRALSRSRSRRCLPFQVRLLSRCACWDPNASKKVREKLLSSNSRAFNLRHMVFERLPLRRGVYLCGGLLDLLHLLRPKQLVSGYGPTRLKRTGGPLLCGRKCATRTTMVGASAVAATLRAALVNCAVPALSLRETGVVREVTCTCPASCSHQHMQLQRVTTAFKVLCS